MKRVLIGVACVSVAALFAVFILVRLSPAWSLDLAQRIKYPDYYSWRAGKGAFPSKQFWIGFNTDRYKKEIFVGRPHDWIQERLPLLTPIPDSNSLLSNYIKSRNLPQDRFAMIKGSMWILEFDDHGVCVDLILPKA